MLRDDAPLENGFCGLETAQRCAEKLGAEWRMTGATRQLEALPFVSLAQVKASLDSLGLKTRVLALTPGNREFVRRKLGEGAIAIAWLQPANRGPNKELDVGHFAVLEQLEPAGDVTFLDATSAQIYKRSPEADTENPLLLAGTAPLHDSVLEIAIRFIGELLTSPWLVGAFGMALVLQFVQARRLRSHWKAILLSCLPLLFLMAFVLSRTTSVSTAASQSNVPPTAKPGSSIVFERARYDLGELMKGSDQPRSLTLHNKSDSPVQLSEIRTSCSCVAGTPHPSLIPPKSNVRRRGFVFQQIPLEITLETETVTAALKVGADFVE
ncbi:MAG: DUF1573 domain-containing protein [Rhodopirellula sp. JB055]|uniref:DUF1573 domain-containing protein n=1 Tax=Rhodopirellula sp. JB055 TaxID=3342846 RepID=UPI00370BD553